MIKSDKLMEVNNKLINTLIQEGKPYDEFDFELNRLYSEFYGFNDNYEEAQELYSKIMKESMIDERLKVLSQSKVVEFCELIK